MAPFSGSCGIPTRRHSTPRYPFRGYIDELRIWSTVRTASQIQINQYGELRVEPGLTAVFPEGGTSEVVFGGSGSGTTSPAV
jgi:hypothetical protein